jgi:hypothetical protein
VKAPKKLNITLPSLNGQEPTKLEGEQYNFRGGPSVFVLREAEDNLGPRLDNPQHNYLRRDLVNALDEINQMHNGSDTTGIYYLEYRPELGENCYRQFEFDRDQNKVLQQVGSDGRGYTQEQFQGLIERLEAAEQQRDQALLTSPNWQGDLSKPDIPAPEPGENLEVPERRIEGPLGPSWTEEASLPKLPEPNAASSTQAQVQTQDMEPELDD